MIGIELKLGFNTQEQATEFLRFLHYIEWCGNIGHSSYMTVNADGDGAFKFKAFMKDPKSGKMKKVGEILKNIIPTEDYRYWDRQTKEYHDWKEKQRADGVDEDNIDRNEISFDLE